jgi:hypothetical protein
MQLLWNALMQLLLQQMLIESQQIIKHVFAFGQANGENLHFEALQKLPSAHPAWCQPILQILKGMMNRTWALRYSIAHHLRLKDEDKEKEALYMILTLLSFLNSWMAQLEAKSHAYTLISINMAKQWDQQTGCKAQFS